jgi:hypothetical protein
MILVDRYDHRINFCGRKNTKKNKELSIKKNTQTLIFEFEYLKSGS